MTFKRTIFSVLCAVACVVVTAAPAKRGLWSKITLADGREVMAQLCGDEHLNFMRDAAGNCYVLDDSVYVEVNQEATLRRAPGLNVRRLANYSSTEDGLGQYGKMSCGPMPSIGKYTIPVVLVEFSDVKLQSTTTVEKITRYCNESGYHDEPTAMGSVRDYFFDQSNGMFVPEFEVIGVVELSRASTYYGRDNSGNIDVNLNQLPVDVVKAVKEQLGDDFSRFVLPATEDVRKEGVPLLCMFYAGKGQATENDKSQLIWPSEWNCDFDADGVHFNSCFVGNELLGSRLMGPSIFCHEFSHSLGLPDFYKDEEVSDGDDAFGMWSLMDYGLYTDNSCFRPMDYTAYERSYLGWLDIPEFEESVMLSPVTDSDGVSAVRISNPANKREYFILEHRQPGTWYPESFGTGIMLSHFSYNAKAWDDNKVNCTDSTYAFTVTADGSRIDRFAYKSHLYGNGTNLISDLTFSNGEKLGYNIEITRNVGGTYTLNRSSDDESAVRDVVRQPAAMEGRRIYTLDGRLVSTSSENLPHGIYVVDGRKVVK